MRLVDARNHRQGHGDQRPRLTASRRCVQDGDREHTAPTSLLCGMSAVEGGTDQQGEGAPYLVKLLFCTAVFGYPSPCRELAPVCGRHCGRRDGPYIHLTYVKPRAGNGGIGQKPLYERQTAATRSTQRRSAAGIDHPAGTAGIGYGSACAVYRGARGRDRAREQPPERDLCVRLR